MTNEEIRGYILFFLLIISILIVIAYTLHPKKSINKEFFSWLNKHIEDFRGSPRIITDFLNQHPDIFNLYPYCYLLQSIYRNTPTCKWNNFKHATLQGLGQYGTEVFINLDNENSRLITDLFVAKFKFENLFWKRISDIPESIEFIRSMPDLFCFSGVEEKPFWAIGKPHKLEMFGRPLYIYSNETDILGLSAVYVGLFINDKDRLPKHLRYYIKAVLKLQKSMVK